MKNIRIFRNQLEIASFPFNGVDLNNLVKQLESLDGDFTITDGEQKITIRKAAIVAYAFKTGSILIYL